jgi:hypothetical protein
MTNKSYSDWAAAHCRRSIVYSAGIPGGKSPTDVEVLLQRQ